ncbi:MAG TPA: nucleoside hydrolase [Acidimicrobiales bacterium]|nr:nucleoside hydrolase [Acidimicrobiales bacterium]
MRVHLDTDFGGDTDDACALALLLGWPEVEIVGITTNLDHGGRRAGLAAWFLELAGCSGIPVVAGAGASLTTGERYASTWGDPRYWPEAVPPRPAPAGAALELLAESIGRGATIVAIGAFTNLAMLETDRPGTLGAARVVAMGGWSGPLRPGFPEWGQEMDFNTQVDRRAAEITFTAAGALTAVTLAATVQVHLREAALPRLRAAGPVGTLLADQAEAYAADGDKGALGRAHPGLPDDLLNFHHDPLAAAVAVGWPGAVLEPRAVDPGGRDREVVAGIDGDWFTDAWLTAVEAIGSD